MDLRFIVLSIVLLVSGVCGLNKTAVKSIPQALALNVLRSTVNSTKNSVVSILPLQFALCKLASVAKGKAKEELLSALGFTDDEQVNTFYRNLREILNMLKKTDLTAVNKIYLNYIEGVNLNFMSNSSVLYGVNVERVGFKYPNAATNFINRAVASAMLRRVEDIIKPSDIDKYTTMLLISAAHFKPTWEVPFDYNLSKMRRFQFLNNSIKNIHMMSKAYEFLYYDARDYKVLTTKLGSMGCTMTFIQPDFLSLHAVLGKMQKDPDLLQKARNLMKFRQMKLILPTLKIKTEHDLTGHLKNIGLKAILSNKTKGLNAIYTEGFNASNMFVSKVKQKLFFEIDEFGLARWGAGIARYLPNARSPPSTMEFALDRPFYFSVNLEVTRAETYELFSGVYYGPES